MASLSGNDEVDSAPSSEPWVAKVSSLPPRLTLRGKRMVLKTPTLQDDVVMCEIFSDLLTIQYLPQFRRSGGWSLEEMASRRESIAAAQNKDEGLVVYIHLLEDSNGSESFRRGPDEVENLILAGTTGFKSINLEKGTGEIGIILHHLYWRKGLATEAMYLCLLYAFESLGLQRVDWITSMDNKDMRAWCEHVLQIRAVDVTTDSLGPSLEYSLLHSDWQSRVNHFLKEKVYSRKS